MVCVYNVPSAGAMRTSRELQQRMKETDACSLGVLLKVSTIYLGKGSALGLIW